MTRMNRFYTWVGLPLVALGLLTLSACDNFGDLNVNPTQADQIDPNYKITDIELRIAGERYENWRTNLIYSSTMIQHLAALPGYWSGDKYLYNSDYSASMWDRYYPNIAKNIEDLKLQTCGDEALVNYCSTARILRVLMYHRLTDLYGDVPYSEAGLGYIEGNVTPKYDPQQEIYADMLKELEEAAAALDASKEVPSGDLMYGGDATKMRRFAYSLMLRLGMRMSKADPAAAQQWVQKAIAGGVMQSNADNAALPHDPAAWRNGVGEVFLADASQHLSQTFVNWMKSHGDPRLTVYGQLPDAGAPALGLPNGYDANTIPNASNWVACTGTPAPSPCGLDAYMVVNPAIVGVEDPTFFQTYAEVELYLAEAAVRGWGATDAAAHYNAGVRAAMTYLAAYGGASTVIENSAIDAYLAANPFNAATAMQQIGEQVWAAVFLNEYEAFANWRRTGYPNLTPVNYPGNVTGGTIPRRLRYNQSEAVSNAENYQAALQRQGPDELTTRVWWDKP